MKSILKKYHFLNESEIDYLNDLADNFVIHQFDIYHQTRVDFSKLLSYQNNINKFITDNFEDEYSLKAMELNRITDSDAMMDGFHNDHSDLTFVTYFNTDFKGGEFEYIDDNENHVFIKPEVNMTLIMDQNSSHRVTKVIEGQRFSLASFFVLKMKNENQKKTII